MRIGAFEINESVPELHQPHAIAMVRPWVDVGSVGTLTLRRLERHFDAKEIGKLARPGHFFDFTRYRPTTRFVDGTRVVTVPNSTISYAQPEDGPEFLFFHLLEPHAMGEDYTESVVEVFKFFGVSRYCRLGAMYDAVPHTRPLLVTGALGGATPLEGKTVPIRERQSRYQGPTTILNLITDNASELGIDTMNLMAHLPQYVQLEEDFHGTSRMLDVLASLYSIPDELAPRRRGERQYRELDSAVDRNDELKGLISQLETYYDSHYDTENSAESYRCHLYPPPSRDRALPAGLGSTIRRARRPKFCDPSSEPLHSGFNRIVPFELLVYASSRLNTGVPTLRMGSPSNQSAQVWRHFTK